MVKISYNYKKGIDKIKIEKKIKLKELLLNLGINPEEVIVKRNNKIVTDEDLINDEDEIKIFRIASRG